MKFDKKYFHILKENYIKGLKKKPHFVGFTFITLFSLLVGVFSGVDSFKNSHTTNKSTFKEWENFKEDQGRSVASAFQKCNEFGVDVNTIKYEISLLEKELYVTNVVEGSWKGVNLSKLNAIQAQFITDHDEQLGDRNFSYNFKGCSDVPCILNKIYQDPTQESGLISYYWYLKTGSVLGMTNNLPGQSSKKAGIYNNSEHKYYSYLFNKEELYNFYSLAKKLPQRFLHNPLLKSVHKVPDNSKIEGVLSQNDCAHSFSSGQILITAKCMASYNGYDSFFQNVPHQMAHFIDFNTGKSRGLSSYSNSEEWMENSGWRLDEYWSGNRYKFNWRSALSNKNFFGKLGKSSPQEQFTDYLSHYRFDPEISNTTIPKDIRKNIGNQFFNGQRFSKRGMYKQYLKLAVSKWMISETEIWGDCFERHLTNEMMEKDARGIASLEIENPLNKCVENKIPGFLNNLASDIKQQAEGCHFYNWQEYEFQKRKFTKTLDRYLSEKIVQKKLELQSKGVQVLAAQKIKNKFIKEFDPTAIYIRCNSSEDSKKCYNAHLEVNIHKNFKKYDYLSMDYRSMIMSDVLSMYSYERISEQAQDMIKKFIMPYYSIANFKSKELWSNCKAKGSDDSESLDDNLKFSAGLQYVDAKLLNCLNDNIEQSVYSILSESVSKEIGGETREFKLNKIEAQFVYSNIENRLIQSLTQLMYKDAKMEQSKFDNFFTSGKDKILAAVLKQDDFMTNVFSVTHLENKCLNSIAEYYPETVHYHTPSEMDKKYGRKICSTFLSNDKVRNKLDDQFASKWKENKSSLEVSFHKSYKNKIENCDDSFPQELGKNYVKNSRLRKICIEESYNESIHETVSEWKSSEDYEQFRSKERELISTLEQDKSKRIQKAIGTQKVVR